MLWDKPISVAALYITPLGQVKNALHIVDAVARHASLVDHQTFTRAENHIPQTVLLVDEMVCPGK